LFRNQKLLEIVREFECVLCGAEDGTVVAAHSNQLRDGKGKGIKAHDYRIAALCYRCHMAIDQGHRMNKQEKEAMWEEAHRKTIGFLFERGKLWVQ
jgi:hypothetical protein